MEVWVLTKPPIYDILLCSIKLQRDLSLTLLHVTSCLAPVLEEDPNYTYMMVRFRLSLAQTPMFVLWPWRNLLSTLNQGPSLNLFMYPIKMKMSNKVLVNNSF
jgi:hypothetical protein